MKGKLIFNKTFFFDEISIFDQTERLVKRKTKGLRMNTNTAGIKILINNLIMLKLIPFSSTYSKEINLYVNINRVALLDV